MHRASFFPKLSIYLILNGKISGMVIAYAKGAYLSWRLVSWLNIIYTIVPIVLIHLFVPESPVWLVAKGRVEDAAKSLKFLYRAYPAPEHTVSQSILFIVITISNEVE